MQRTKAKHDMTKVNTKSNAITTYDASVARKSTRDRKANASTNVAPTIVLKTLHDDICRDVATFTITTKQMRTWLRANMNDIHERNSSWIFTQSQYDVVRSHFDVAYRAKIERASKRVAKSNDTPRVRKSRAKSNATPIVDVVDIVQSNDVVS